MAWFIHMEDDWQVRAMVPGVCDPARVFAQVLDNAELAQRTGAAMGAILAEQHAGVHAADVADWLPLQPEWPRSPEWIRERLGRVTNDTELIAGVEAVLTRCEGLTIAEADRALVPGDLGFHNIAVDPATLQVGGVFDYEGAAWADRHHDFRYLVFDRENFEVLDAAIAVYETKLHRKVDRGRVFLYNAACAITFLANRDGFGPEDRPCGRTLAEDERWSRHAIATAREL